MLRGVTETVKQDNYPILGDSDVAGLEMSRAVACMEDAFRLHAEGKLVAPARIAADLGEAGNLVYTCGGSTEGAQVSGFRFYDMKHLNSPNRSELNAVFSSEDGRLLGLVVGPRLGQMRTGAIGGVAMKYLSRTDSKVLGMVGAGRQARTQLPAALAVRNFETVRVFSRTAERRDSFVAEMTKELNIEIEPVDSAEAAVGDADVVLCTTASKEPVIRVDWLKPGAHINNVGPKFKDGQEVGMDVVERAGLLTTDTFAQMETFGDNFILHDTPYWNKVVELSAIVSGNRPGRQSDEEITLFHSLGLAGTEVLLASELL